MQETLLLTNLFTASCLSSNEAARIAVAASQIAGAAKLAETPEQSQ